MQIFSLFWLSSDEFSKLKNHCFPDASTHLLGSTGKGGWRFVANVNDSDDNVLVQLQKIEPQLCTADIREMTLTASREDLAIAGQAVGLVRWHQVRDYGKSHAWLTSTLLSPFPAAAQASNPPEHAHVAAA